MSMSDLISNMWSQVFSIEGWPPGEDPYKSTKDDIEELYKKIRAKERFLKDQAERAKQLRKAIAILEAQERLENALSKAEPCEK